MDAAHKVREYWEQKGFTLFPYEVILNVQLPPLSSGQPGNDVSAVDALHSVGRMLPCLSPQSATSVKGWQVEVDLWDCVHYYDHKHHTRKPRDALSQCITCSLSNRQGRRVYQEPMSYMV